jgi:hypothetical protein
MIKKYGRLRSEKIGLSIFLINKKEKWPAFGQDYRYKYIFYNKFKQKPLLHLKKINLKEPKVIILGAGQGNDLKLFKEDLSKFKINPIIDVFSLTKSLSPEIKKKIVNKDFSRNKAFESIEAIKDRKLINQIKGKYDLVVAPLSVGVYTDHIPYNLLLTSLLLNKNGKAYIEVNNYSPKIKERYYKFIEMYNKQKKEKKTFNIRIINKKNSSVYLEIKRLN